MRFLAALTALFGVAALAAPVAATNTTFLFTGYCFDCTGTATAELVLKGYTLGDVLTTGNFVSFTYSSNLTSFELDAVTSLVGSFTILPGSAFVVLFNDDFAFSSLSTPFFSPWCAGATGTCGSDFGFVSSWSLAGSVPEPAMWVAMVAGFGVLGTTMRRPRRIGALYA
jgi:hypothetical protein